MLATSMTAANARRDSRVIKIRDFAFPAADPRHTGQGVDAPRASRQSGAYSDYDDEGFGFGMGKRASAGWGPLRFGSKLWNLATGGGSRVSKGGLDGTPMPTSSDFARNFDVSSPTDVYPPDSDGYEDEEDGDDGYPDQGVPLLPGLYRAMFAFEPEGTAEMALSEDQIVRIIGRGGGIGWAVAEDEHGGHALVPESYLEPYQLDEDPVGPH